MSLNNKSPLAKTLLAAAAIAAMPLAPAMADSAIGSQIMNGQINLQTNWSNLNGSVDTVGGDVVAQGSAAGNMVDITTMNDTRVQNSQIVGPQANIGSNVNMDANNVWGSVGVSSQALCNGAQVSTDPILTKINSYQECNARDPYSSINTNITNVAGNAVVQGSAIANSFEADSNAPNFPIVTKQISNSASVSNVNANMFNVGKSVGLSSSAVGNTAQIIHYGVN
jgi:hypothetical protein